MLGLFSWLLKPFFSTRKVFVFWNGRRRVAVDPMAVWESLINDPEYSMETHGAVLDDKEADDKDFSDALLRCSRAVQRAFGVPAFENGGLTRSECLLLLEEYFNYLDLQKKSTNEPLTSLTSTELESFPIASVPENYTSDCGKTPTGYNCVEQL